MFLTSKSKVNFIAVRIKFTIDFTVFRKYLIIFEIVTKEYFNYDDSQEKKNKKN